MRTEMGEGSFEDYEDFSDAGGFDAAGSISMKGSGRLAGFRPGYLIPDSP